MNYQQNVDKIYLKRFFTNQNCYNIINYVNIYMLMLISAINVDRKFSNFSNQNENQVFSKAEKKFNCK